LLSYKKLPLFLIIAKVVFAGLGRLYGACATHLFCASMREGEKMSKRALIRGAAFVMGKDVLFFSIKFPGILPADKRHFLQKNLILQNAC
jgi:hypothetical protein